MAATTTSVRDGVLVLIDERDACRNRARRAEHTLRAHRKSARRVLATMPADVAKALHETLWGQFLESMLHNIANEGE